MALYPVPRAQSGRPQGSVVIFTLPVIAVGAELEGACTLAMSGVGLLTTAIPLFGTSSLTITGLADLTAPGGGGGTDFARLRSPAITLQYLTAVRG